MKTVEETITKTIYQSEVLNNVRTTDPSFAHAIEWADEHPVIWRIVTGSKSKAFGLGEYSEPSRPVIPIDRASPFRLIAPTCSD